jgi:GNAT superfamily N-acetyltransferase
METITIRRARPDEHETLTEISFAAKRHWGDPEAYFEVWKDELTITREYIESNAVFAAEAPEGVAGYLSIVRVAEDFYAGPVFVLRGYWLEHIFVKPEHMHRGIGSRLVSFARGWCAQNGIGSLYIFSDPHARGFYERLGAAYLGESASSIPGRTVPIFELVV